VTDTDNLLGDADRPRNARYKRESRGPLHDLITRALPDLVDQEHGVANLHKLAEALEMTYQGVYKWFKPGRQNLISTNRVDRIVEMSRNQSNPPEGFKPVTQADFWDFLPR